MISIGELVASDFEQMMLLEPRADLDCAIVGVSYDSFGPGAYRAVYDADKLLAAFMRMNDWGRDTAQEWIDFNVTSAYVGPGTPVYMDPITPH